VTGAPKRARLPVAIRPMKSPDDDPIVYDSWAGSLADELEITEEREKKRFKRGQFPVLRELVAHGRVLVATSRKDLDRVVGWICYEPADVLHFVFVKKPYRQFGVARQLIEAAGMPDVARASHFTSWGFPRVARLFESLTHDPTLGVK